MNICMISGKIISKIDFKFIINSHNKSIATFYMKLVDKNIVKVVSYNEMADKVYSTLKQGQYVIIEGRIKNEGIEDVIEIVYFEKITKLLEKQVKKC